MPLIPTISSERREKITKISDEIGELTRTILFAIQKGESEILNDERQERLHLLKRELALLKKEHARADREESRLREQIVSAGAQDFNGTSSPSAKNSNEAELRQ